MSDDYYEATVLTVSQANEAVQNNPEWVELPNLEHLTPEVAAVLARSTGLLQLDGLRELPADVAEALSNRSSDDLNLSLVLDGLTELSVDAAQALAPHEGRISLSGLPNISLAVASSLAESEWDRGLTLNGLTTITPDIAAALAKCRGPLCLDGITQLTPDSARALTQREAPLSLKGLTSLTTEVATALAAWVERTGDCLELSGLAEAPAEALKTLRSQPNIYLPDTLGDASDSDTDDCARCPECGKPLRSSKAQQCFECGANWRSTSSSNIAATTGKADAVRVVSQQFKDRTNTVIEGVMAHLRDDNAKDLLGPGLSPLIGRGSLKSIVTFALYADVLRMVRDMVMADGEISDEEVQESLGLLSVLAAGFAKVRKEYASFTQLTPETARQFLSQYESDTGLFGRANEATKWAGVGLCRNIRNRVGESGPLTSLGDSLIAWADAIAGSDGRTAGEQSLLDTLRQLLASSAPAEVKGQQADTADASVLTEEIAQAFLEDSSSVDLSEFVAIEDSAAKLLATHQGDLALDGLASMTQEAAVALAGHRHRLSLEGLTVLPDDVAEALSKHNPRDARFRLSKTPTLCIGGFSGTPEISERGLLSLSKYVGSLSLSFDPNEKQEEPQWQAAIQAFYSRQDHRVFREFTDDMTDLFGRKDLSDADRNESIIDWVFDESLGKSAWEVFEEFKDLVSTCGNRSIWLGSVENEAGSSVWYALLGTDEEVVNRLSLLPDRD